MTIIINSPFAFAQTGTFCSSGTGYLPVPTTHKITSNAGPRSCTGCSANHTGTDYATPCGANINGPPAGCVKTGGTGTGTAGGYGNVAQFDCGGGVTLQYAHLQGANAYNAASNTITTGTSGASTGCHLDYKVFVNGKSIDAQCATGTVSGLYTYGNSSVKHGVKCPYSGAVNVCDTTVQNELKKHSDQVLGGANSGGMTTPSGSTGGGSTTPPPAGGGGAADSHADHADHTDPGAVVNQGTQGLQQPGGSTTPPPIGETQPPPEEQQNPAPTPGEAYNPSASQPVCNNSTCITQETIDNAKHKNVKYDKVKDYLDYLLPDSCKTATKTKVTVFRQAVSETKKYDDAFCTNQGCTYKNQGGQGAGQCQ